MKVAHTFHFFHLHLHLHYKSGPSLCAVSFRRISCTCKGTWDVIRWMEKKKKKKKRGLFIGLRCQHTAWAKILESWKQISTTLVPFSSHISSFLISGHRLPFFQLSWSNSQLRGVRIYQPKPIIHFSNIYSIHLLFHIGIKFLKQMKYVGSKFWLATNERKIVALCRYCLLNIWVFQLVSTGDFLLL